MPGRKQLPQFHQRAVSVQQSVAVRLQWCLRVRTHQLPLVSTAPARRVCLLQCEAGADGAHLSDRDTVAQGVLTGRHHLAFQAHDVAMVQAFHQAALANGGRDNGAPGLRPYHPHYYAAFVLAPDGNTIEAVVHGVAQHSADAMQITF
ncbi:VOC family protein [Xanthomonas nasturtii]|nr:VOC family protein [Xanthomonas nasturtii]MCL1504914.1 VOC family protein [Xanthomonas nasturtii]MCL1524522.1 VOC family protein [Xanthomonas nasturtii]